MNCSTAYAKILQHKGEMNVDQMQFEAAMKTVISALQAAGYDYNAIQAIVNAKLK